MLNIILIIIIVVVIIAFVFFYLNFKKKLQSNENSIASLKAIYEEENDFFKREINRLNYIVASYKKHGTANEFNQIIAEQNIAQKPINQDSENIQLIELTSEKEKLEDEKRKFQEKNKKLWEQSIAIHKEKERIDKLKSEIETRHKEVTDSIKYAKRIQTALIPTTEQINSCLSDYFIFWQPRDIVSGDFYWIEKIENQIIIVAADCTGHGVPGAFMSALGISFLNEIVNRHKTLTANQILEEMRILVKTSLQQTGSTDEAKDGMDMALCILNLEAGKLYFAGANNPMYQYKNEEINEFDGLRNPIGIYMKEKSFTCHEIEIQKNDVYYLFSDGYCDEFGGPKGDKFKKPNFRKLLIDINKENQTMPQQHKTLKNTMDNWLGDKYKQIDDILVIGFKI